MMHLYIMQSVINLETSVSVLILVVMDDALVPKSSRVSLGHWVVLILVVMDDALVPTRKERSTY